MTFSAWRACRFQRSNQFVLIRRILDFGWTLLGDAEAALTQNLGQRTQNAHRFSSRSGSQFHSLMQVVATPDPSELTGRLIGGYPSECAELVEGECASGSSGPYSSVASHGASCFRYFTLRQVPRSATNMNGSCTSTFRFEWVILSLPAPGIRPLLLPV